MRLLQWINRHIFLAATLSIVALVAMVAWWTNHPADDPDSSGDSKLSEEAMAKIEADMDELKSDWPISSDEPGVLYRNWGASNTSAGKAKKIACSYPDFCHILWFENSETKIAYIAEPAEFSENTKYGDFVVHHMELDEAYDGDRKWRVVETLPMLLTSPVLPIALDGTFDRAWLTPKGTENFEALYYDSHEKEMKSRPLEDPRLSYPKVDHRIRKNDDEDLDIQAIRYEYNEEEFYVQLGRKDLGFGVCVGDDKNDCEYHHTYPSVGALVSIGGAHIDDGRLEPWRADTKFNFIDDTKLDVEISHEWKEDYLEVPEVSSTPAEFAAVQWTQDEFAEANKKEYKNGYLLYFDSGFPGVLSDEIIDPPTTDIDPDSFDIEPYFHSEPYFPRAAMFSDPGKPASRLPVAVHPPGQPPLAAPVNPVDKDDKATLYNRVSLKDSTTAFIHRDRNGSPIMTQILTAYDYN